MSLFRKSRDSNNQGLIGNIFCQHTFAIGVFDPGSKRKNTNSVTLSSVVHIFELIDYCILLAWDEIGRESQQ